MIEVTIKFKLDWEDYDDVADDLIIEDMTENLELKDGITYEVIDVSRG